jgi:tetratricopeptide (TPR) repeat protein
MAERQPARVGDTAKPSVERKPFADGHLGVGMRVGPYEVIRRIGSGGMGTVYLCKAVETCPIAIGTKVAVKVLRSADTDERKRFERESRYLQSLQHPGIVRVLDTGEESNRLFLVMPLIDGKRLDDLVGPKLELLSEAKAIDWMVQALEALHVAHLAGILHRDLKPGNLMLDRDGRIKLLDFGLASAPDYESRLTRDGDVVGTPAYMPPEQAAGRREELSRRSDIYGMGACLYELVTGQQPFAADNAMATLRAIIDEPLLAPSKLRQDLSPDLETVILVAMAKDQPDRYRTAEEMAGDLRRIRNGMRIRAHRLGRMTQMWRSLIRNRRTVAAVALLVFVIGATAGMITLSALRRAHERATAVEAATTNAWTIEATWPTPDPNHSLIWSDHAPFGEKAQVASLPAIEGPVRLTAAVILAGSATGAGTAAELLVNDRDIGAGYRLRLELGIPADQLILLREDRIVASRTVGQLPRGLVLDLVIEHLDGALQASITYTPTAESEPRQQSFTFLDLAPLQGPDASGVYLSRIHGTADVKRVLLERQRSGELVSALATADAFRQDKRYARAQQLYQAFLRDHPSSAQARDAKLRLGLCQEGTGDIAGALATFIQVAEENRDSPRYILVATFHAWSCALRLGRYAEAERYFEAIRRTYDLPTLAAAVPESILRDLRQDYTSRALSLASQDAERAMFLALTASELAGYLNEGQQVADGLLLAGDLLLALGRPEVARETWLRAAGDLKLDAGRRLAVQVRMGHVERILGQVARSAEAYRKALTTAAPAERGRIRLWLGDLASDNGENDLAETTWRERDPATDRVTASLLKQLGESGEPLRDSDPAAKDPDVPYVNARLALLAGDRESAMTWLERSATQAPTYRWPAPLARRLLARLQETKQPEP